MIRIDIDRYPSHYAVWAIDSRTMTVLDRRRFVFFRWSAELVAKKFQRKYGGNIVREDYRS